MHSVIGSKLNQYWCGIHMFNQEHEDYFACTNKLGRQTDCICMIA